MAPQAFWLLLVSVAKVKPLVCALLSRHVCLDFDECAADPFSVNHRCLTLSSAAEILRGWASRPQTGARGENDAARPRLCCLHHGRAQPAKRVFQEAGGVKDKSVKITDFKTFPDISEKAGFFHPQAPRFFLAFLPKYCDPCGLLWKHGESKHAPHLLLFAP